MILWTIGQSFNTQNMQKTSHGDIYDTQDIVRVFRAEYIHFKRL